MRCLCFTGESMYRTIDAYNTWAKDKALSKDVIVHSHVVQPMENFCGELIILVFYDENIHPAWVGVTE